MLSTVAGLLAEAVFVQGRWSDAEALAAETEQLAAEDDIDAQTLWRLAKARAAALRGDLGEAEQLAREAVELLEPTDHVVNQIGARATLAAILRLSGNDAEAAEWLAQAQELADAKGSPIVLEQVPKLAAREQASPAPL